MATLRLRIDFDGDRRLGPGKVRLMELVEQTGSISAAAREMEMSYRRAWGLVEALNRTFREPVIITRGGGAGGGGAQLTGFGRALVAGYRAMEQEAATALAQHMAMLDEALAAPSA